MAEFRWSDTPQLDEKGWHGKFGGQEWRYDRKGVYLREKPDTPVESKGEPITCRAILAAYGDEILKASIDHRIPPELIVMTIAIETGMYRSCSFTGPKTFRWEVGVNDYSAGPMQLLSSTARNTIQKMNLVYKPSDIPRYAAKPPSCPDMNALYDGELNIDVGTAYIKSNIASTGFDPILVAACYNAGRLRQTDANRWHLFTYGDHLDRASEWIGDACQVLSVLRGGEAFETDDIIAEAPEIEVQYGDPKTRFELGGLTEQQAKEEEDFYRDSGAEVELIEEEGGLFTLLVRYKKEIPKPKPTSSGALNVQPPDRNGFVICIDRKRTEKRPGQSFARTVGFYQAFVNGEPIPELCGVAVERQGPGDNTRNGTDKHSRLKEGRYPLFTHAGASNKYRTYGFANPGGVKVRPWPSIRIENTGQRSGVLIHCAKGYLMSIGCINLTGELTDADDDIEFSDSRARVISLIQGMKKHLGNRFPTYNNKQIPDAWLIIRNEP